jgi:glyoxylase-like metal-dependent hydrolase (beta-lactamase superfamily II)
MGAPIAIHTADAQAMANADTVLGVARKRGKLVRLIFPLLDKLFKPEPTQADLLVSDGEQLPIPGLKAEVLHTPGHTPGHCCLIVENRYAFAGDLLSSTGKAHIQPYYAQDWNQISTSLSRLKATAPEMVYPAHGKRPILNHELQDL